MLRVNDVRKLFKDNFDESKDMQELIGVSFIADEDSIFGEVNYDYVDREIAWYNSQSLCVYDIPGETPKIWLDVSNTLGEINSNYGWCIFSKENGSQYDNVLYTLKTEPNSRRGSMIYTRPSMQRDYNYLGMSDFMCTNAVNYFIRDNKLHAVVQMRSNDVVYGYKNDRAWQTYVLNKLADDLGIEAGDLVWNAASLHIYPRHYDLLRGE